MNKYKTRILRCLLLLAFFGAIGSIVAQEPIIINGTYQAGDILNVTAPEPIEANINVHSGGKGALKSARNIVFKPGTSIVAESEGFLDAGIDKNILPNIGDEHINWAFERLFDEHGKIVAEGITYSDMLNNPIQAQWKNLTTNIVLGSKTIYDEYGREVISTLSAPISKVGQYGYDESFITNPENQPYSYIDFDMPGGYGGINDPKPVNVNSTLGQYYSNSNADEPYVDATEFPYSRVEYHPFFTGKAKRSSGVGEVFKMGSGHESEMLFKLPIGYGELNHFCAEIPVDLKGYKLLSKSADGKIFITYADKDENVLATCQANFDAPEAAYTCSSFPIEPNTYFPVHIPNASLNTIQLTDLGPYTDNYYKVYDAITGNLVSQPDNGPVTLDPGFYLVEYFSTVPIPIDVKITGYPICYKNYSFSLYNSAGSLLKTIDPKGIVTTFKYNSHGALLETNHPDEGLSKFYYHDDGRIKASVDAQQRFDAATDKVRYSYTLYDEDYLITEVGVCEETGVEGTHHFTPVAYNTRSDVTRTGYDYADPDLLSTYPTCGLTQQNLRGMVSYTETGAYTSNSPDSFNPDYKTWYSYDLYGRVEWTAQHHKELGLKVTQYEYHPNGSVEKVIYQPNSNIERMEHIYAYDKDTRLSYVTSKKTDNADVYEQTTSYKYYMHGSLKRVEVGNGLQGIDYVYNINGQLKSINNAGTDLVYNGEPLDPGKDGYGTSAFPKDVFGMSLDYYEGDYTRSGTFINTNIVNGKSQYNGNIHSIRWKIPRLLEDYPQALEYPHNVLGENKEWAYVFDYNDRNWLSEAKFGTYQHGFTGNGTFTENQYYKVNDLNYDENGNITSLDRSAIFGNLTMDNMSYSYYSNSNKLQTVQDAAANNGDLKDIPQGWINFQYNNIGQLTQKSTTPMSGSASVQTMQYDAYGKLKQVTDALNTYAIYDYNDQGYRTHKLVSTEGNPAATNYIYDINGNVLAIYSGTELIEQPVYGSGRIGSFMNQSKKYFYEINDHLGNVRAVVSQNSTGNMEVNEYCSFYPYGMPMPDRRLRSAEKYRYGFQGEFAEEDDETGYNFFELRAYDSRLGRWMTCDPAGQFASPYIGMGNNPVNGVDPDGARNIDFNSDGSFKGIFKDVWWHNLIFGNRGRKLDENGNVEKTFRFSHPSGDYKEIKKDIKSTIKLFEVKENDTYCILHGAGAFSEYNSGLEKGIPYIQKEAEPFGKFDFVQNGIPNYFDVSGFVKENSFYLVGRKAYNFHNFGNFLYGAGGSSLRINLLVLLAGAHYNSYFNPSKKNGYEPQLDSWDDQRSIVLGFRYAKKHKYDHFRVIIGQPQYYYK